MIEFHSVCLRSAIRPQSSTTDHVPVADPALSLAATSGLVANLHVGLLELIREDSILVKPIGKRGTGGLVWQ